MWVGECVGVWVWGGLTFSSSMSCCAMPYERRMAPSFGMDSFLKSLSSPTNLCLPSAILLSSVETATADLIFPSGSRRKDMASPRPDGSPTPVSRMNDNSDDPCLRCTSIKSDEVFHGAMLISSSANRATVSFRLSSSKSFSNLATALFVFSCSVRFVLLTAREMADIFSRFFISLSLAFNVVTLAPKKPTAVCASGRRWGKISLSKPRSSSRLLAAW